MTLFGGCCFHFLSMLRRRRRSRKQNKKHACSSPSWQMTRFEVRGVIIRCGILLPLIHSLMIVIRFFFKNEAHNEPDVSCPHTSANIETEKPPKSVSLMRRSSSCPSLAPKLPKPAHAQPCHLKLPAPVDRVKETQDDRIVILHFSQTF